MLQFDEFCQKIMKKLSGHQKNCQIAAVLIFCPCGNHISTWYMLCKVRDININNYQCSLKIDFNPLFPNPN